MLVQEKLCRRQSIYSRHVGTKKGESMKSPMGTQTSAAWMTRVGWILTGLSAAFMIYDGVLKALFPLGPFLLGEIERLGEAKDMVVPFAILYLVCTVLYLIPKTVILGAILLTGYLGGAESDSDARLWQPSLYHSASSASWSDGVGRRLAAG